MNKFAIVVGHHSFDPGMKPVAPLSGNEHEWNLSFASDVYKIATEKGLNAVIFYRSAKDPREIISRSHLGQLVNAWAGTTPTVAIELHLNSSVGKATGTETLYEDYQDFAEIVQKSVCEALCTNDRGVKKLQSGERGHRNLDALKIPGCIIEPVFANNPEDAAILNSKKSAYALALVGAVLQYFNKEKTDGN